MTYNNIFANHILISCFVIVFFCTSKAYRLQLNMVESTCNIKVTNYKDKTSKKFIIPKSKTTILDGVNTNGPYIPYSCQAGQCSSCMGKILKGSVDQSGQTYLNQKGFIYFIKIEITSEILTSINPSFFI